jgi:hypothetical protein
MISGAATMPVLMDHRETNPKFKTENKIRNEE